MAAPLLEEGDVLLGAKISQVADPVGIDTPVPGARLATSDQSVDAVEIEPLQRVEQRLRN